MAMNTNIVLIVVAGRVPGAVSAAAALAPRSGRRLARVEPRQALRYEGDEDRWPSGLCVSSAAQCRGGGGARGCVGLRDARSGGSRPGSSSPASHRPPTTTPTRRRRRAAAAVGLHAEGARPPVEGGRRRTAFCRRSRSTNPALVKALMMLAMQESAGSTIGRRRGLSPRRRARLRLQAFSARPRLEPCDAVAYDGMARIWRDWGMPDLALTEAYRALHCNQKSAEIYNTLGHRSSRRSVSQPARSGAYQQRAARSTRARRSR